MIDNPAATNDVAVSLRARIYTGQPHTARIWNYWLGGKDHLRGRPRAGDQIRRLHPGHRGYARADRLFLAAAPCVTWSAVVGIRRFLDIGTGLPTADNTHEGGAADRAGVPDRVRRQRPARPRARACPADQHAGGRTDYLDEDLRSVDAILEHAAKTLDFSEPVALMLLGVVIFIGDDEDQYGLVRQLTDRLPGGQPPGAVAHRHQPVDAGRGRAVKFWNEHGTRSSRSAPPEDVARFFDGLELLEPGVVSCSRWRRREGAGADSEEVAMFGGVARRPDRAREPAAAGERRGPEAPTMEVRAPGDPGAARCRSGQRGFGFSCGSHACGTTAQVVRRVTRLAKRSADSSWEALMVAQAAVAGETPPASARSAHRRGRSPAPR
ncbi:SAM-dependent methyltransferase [Streptomyces tricolor]|nr:SAM-dependent methyltransferase [Streptomyces tricolor]